MLLLAHSACVDPRETGADDTSPADAGQDSSADSAPAGDSMDDPIPVDDPSGATPMAEVLDPAGDVDWYSVELAEGDFLQVQTVTVEGEPSDPGFECDGLTDTNPTDPVALVYDPRGIEVVAIDSWAGFTCGPDGIGLVRADRAGTWTIAVTDWNSWEDGGGLFGNDPAGGPEYGYRLYVTVRTAEVGGGQLGTGGELATLAQAGEVDEWTVKVTERAWISLFHAPNTNADVDDLVFELVDESGARVALADDDAFYGIYGGLSMRYPADPGEYTLQVHDGDGVAAAEDWYWLWQWTHVEQAANPESEPNDEFASATMLTTRSGSGEYAGEYVVATFDGVARDGDLDAFSLDVTDGQYLYLVLYTDEVGSALEPELTLYDVDSATVLATAEGDPLALDGERIGADGVATFTIAGTGGSAEGYYLAYLERWDSRRPW